MEVANGVKVLEDGKVYAPIKFFGEEFKYQGKDIVPDINKVVEQTIEEFPDFANKNLAFVLYECSHNNGFATTNTQVRKTAIKNNQHWVCGGVNVSPAVGGTEEVEKQIPRFEELLDKEGFVHKELKPDEISLNMKMEKERNKMLSCMEICPDYRFALFRSDMRPEYFIYGHHAYAEGPKRNFPSLEKVKADALNVAAITQAMNDAFRNTFLELEMPKDNPEDDIKDYCV